MKQVAATILKRNSRTTNAARVVAGILLILLLAQLYGYEGFATTLSAIVPSTDMRLNTALTALIVMAELLALPYLIGMPLSVLMRLLSIGSGLFVSVFWLFTQLTSAHAANSGLLSDTITLPGGVVAFLISLCIFSLFSFVLVSDIQTYRRLRRTEV